eukprot:CAMPEP_0113447038 /NCGR_PEP_ID=MMETSP0014_2-20120614/4029_1 /TAXON_ID=2857 /ORGANISM="Nitzschia sp." /LENGTH=768 /DNA_ID=CAMNT_0000338175 /DNA_START=35 /DNA_END=2341 /DNA_ORIENTATION=+ /assembly_acc=CAM_ASM_000159
MPSNHPPRRQRKQQQSRWGIPPQSQSMGFVSFLVVAFVISSWSTKAAQSYVPMMIQKSSPSFLLQPRRMIVDSSTVLFNSNSRINDSSSNDDVKNLGLNELQTLLRIAVQKEDFNQASTLSDEMFRRLYGEEDLLSLDADDRRRKRKRMSWRGLGVAPWLIDRLDSLNYTFPTTIQINSMEAVNKILSDDGSDGDEEDINSSLEQRVDQNGIDMGVVVSGSTGSGKTISYLAPLLSTLSDSLFRRQRLRVGAEESVGDTSGDLVERISVVTSPVVRTSSRKPVRAGAIATGAALSTLGKDSSKNVKTPLALIVVPTRELGVQTAMMLYELIGGNIKKDPTEIRGKANMFKYKGPKGVRIACILDDEEAAFGLKQQTDVAIVMPKYLGKLMDDGELVPSKLRVVVFDEADLALEESSPDDLQTLFEDEEDRSNSRLTFIVGASVTESLGNLAVKSRILPNGRSYIASATRHYPLTSELDEENATTAKLNRESLQGDEPKTASLKDLDVCLDPGLIHQRVTVGNDDSGLLLLTRMLRKDLKEYEDDQVGRPVSDQSPPRVVIFFPNEDIAKESIIPLRDALWGEHKVCVLLPKIGVNPLQMMEQFKNNETTVMLATPNSVRGLDFPAVTHVYTLYLPTDDPREYVHLAGRVGRVGQSGSVRGRGGRVVSVLKEEDASKMENLASELGFKFDDVVIETSVPTLEMDEDGIVDTESASDVEDMRRYLEDTLSLLSSSEDDSEDDSKSTSSSPMPSGDLIDVDFEDDSEGGFQ